MSNHLRNSKNFKIRAKKILILVYLSKKLVFNSCKHDIEHSFGFQGAEANADVVLKVVGNEKWGGGGKVADDRYWSRTVVIDVRFSLYLAAILDLILFLFPSTHAEKLVIDLSISTGAANMTVLLIMHH